MKTHLTSTCAGLLGAWLMLSGCGGGEDRAGAGGTGDGSAYATPDQVFDAFKAAATRNDLKQFMGCMSARSQNEFALGMFMVSMLLPMGHMDDVAKAEALAIEIESVMAKHGLSEATLEEMDFAAEPPDYDKVFAPVNNKAAFLSDLFAIIAREDSDTPLKMLASASLEDVQLDGEKATGKMVVDGDEKDIEFVKVDGGWLIEMPIPRRRDPSIAEIQPEVKVSAPGTAMGEGRSFKAGWSIAFWDEEDSELVVAFLESEPPTDKLWDMLEHNFEQHSLEVPMITFTVELHEKNGAPDVASPKSWRVGFSNFGNTGPMTFNYSPSYKRGGVEVSGNPKSGGQVKGRFTGTGNFRMGDDNQDYSWNLSFDLPVH